jgi:hypothetical protein
MAEPAKMRRRLVELIRMLYQATWLGPPLSLLVAHSDAQPVRAAPLQATPTGAPPQATPTGAPPLPTPTGARPAAAIPPAAAGPAEATLPTIAARLGAVRLDTNGTRVAAIIDRRSRASEPGS